MGDVRQLSRKSLRRDQILEVHFTPWPDPPPNMMRLPGVQEWWDKMKLCRERDIQSMQRMVNNINQGPVLTQPLTTENQ